MKNSQLIDTLRDIGLTENEAEVYLTSLSLGPTTILKIAKASQIRRTTVYSVIESLKNKGLVHIKATGLKQLYVAEHPDTLENIIESKSNNLKKLLPNFLALYNLKGGESIVKYYEGINSIKNIFDTILDTLKPNDDLLVISNLDKFFSATNDKYFDDFLEKRIKKMIKTRLIVMDCDRARHMKQYSKNMNHELRILPIDSKFSVDVMITPQKITFFNLEEPVSAVSIENIAMIQMHKELFELVWKSLQE